MGGEEVKNKLTLYDLTVEDCPEFFAGGLLFHNCNEYFITVAFNTEYQKFLRGGREDRPMLYAKPEQKLLTNNKRIY